MSRSVPGASSLREDRAFAAAPSSPQAVSPVPASIPLRVLSLLSNRIKREVARRRLARMVEAKRRSFEIQDFAKRRAAALKATRRAEG